MSYKIKKFHAQRKVKAFKFLIDNFSLSMREAQRWIDKKRLYLNGDVVISKTLLLEGDVSVIVFEPVSFGLKPTFETESFALFDKPSGVLVHPKNRHTEYSLTHEAKYLYGSDANITHRIDKETSGLVIVAKNKKAEIEIKKAFENRQVAKGYMALVQGHMSKEILIDAPIAKNREFDDIKLKVQINDGGKPSQTLITPIQYFPKLNQTLVEAKPLTGRQHQIRVHLFHVKHPIVGDPIYGVNFETANRYLNGFMSEEERREKTGALRLMLHARWIEFTYIKRYKLYSQKDIMKEFEIRDKD
ncbi:MAG: RluA family pseudouridine synthase [Epsilonproteobacteria bacterium]|nr:RluA family pseudouridine synthase [Campylobacterota bacterium]